MAKLYNVAELATLLEVDQETVRRWRLRGRNGVRLSSLPAEGLSGERVGKRGHRFTAAAVARFLEENPGLMTPAMEQSLAEPVSLADTLLVDLGHAEMAVSGQDEPDPIVSTGNRTRAVLEAVLQEKVRLHDKLRSQVLELEREIRALRHQIEEM